MRSFESALGQIGTVAGACRTVIEWPRRAVSEIRAAPKARKALHHIGKADSKAILETTPKHAPVVTTYRMGNTGD